MWQWSSLIMIQFPYTQITRLYQINFKIPKSSKYYKKSSCNTWKNQTGMLNFVDILANIHPH